MSRYYKSTEVDEFLNIVGKGNCNLCAFYEDCNSRGLSRKGSHRYCWQVKRFPTADVAEVTHSEWHTNTVRMNSITITCRNCHRTEEISVTNDFEYCPHCGAKMNRARKDEE